MFTHWRNLEGRHWRALERCCESTRGRAQVEDADAEALVDLGWLEPAGYGYRSTPAGHAAHEHHETRLGSPSEPTPRRPMWAEQGDRGPYVGPSRVVISRGPMSPAYREAQPSYWPMLLLELRHAAREFVSLGWLR